MLEANDRGGWVKTCIGASKVVVSRFIDRTLCRPNFGTWVTWSSVYSCVTPLKIPLHCSTSSCSRPYPVTGREKAAHTLNLVSWGRRCIILDFGRILRHVFCRPAAADPVLVILLPVGNAADSQGRPCASAWEHPGASRAHERFTSVLVLPVLGLEGALSYPAVADFTTATAVFASRKALPGSLIVACSDVKFLTSSTL